jgi:hypothetical protein
LPNDHPYKNAAPLIGKYDVNGKKPVSVWIPSRDTAGNGTTTLNDLVGSNNGTLTNMDPATDWVVSDGKTALDFDGTNDEVLLSSAFSTMPFSVSLWANCRQNTVNQQAFGIGSSASTNQLFAVSFRGDLPGDPIVAQMRGSDNTLNTWAVSAAGYQVNTWYHILAVFTSTTLRQIYINGVAGTQDTTAYDVQPLNRMSIGSLPRITSVTFLNGLVDDVRFFDQELVLADAQYLTQRRGITAGGGIIPILRQHYAAMGAR